MTLCDVVGRLFQGVCKKGAVHHGLFLLGPPGTCMWAHYLRADESATYIVGKPKIKYWKVHKLYRDQ